MATVVGHRHHLLSTNCMPSTPHPAPLHSVNTERVWCSWGWFEGISEVDQEFASLYVFDPFSNNFISFLLKKHVFEQEIKQYRRR